MSSEVSGRPWALAFVVFAAALPLVWQATRWSVWTVSLRSESGGILKWYVDGGRGFSEAEGGYGSVAPGETVRVEVLLPAARPERMRLDPVDSPGPVRIESVEWEGPLPWMGGRLDPAIALWEGVRKVPEGTAGRLEASGTPPDMRAVWNAPPGLSAGLLWSLRLIAAAAIAAVAFVFGLAWNRRQLRLIESNHG